MKKSEGIVRPMQLRALVLNGAVNGAMIRLDDEGHGLLVGVAVVGDSELLLGTSRGREPRYFNSIDGAVSAMQDCGIHEFTLNATGFISRGKKASANKTSIRSPLSRSE
jgi:hypothetical protein